MTQQQLSVVTLGVAELAASRRFYADGFGWRPVDRLQPAWAISDDGPVTFSA